MNFKTLILLLFLLPLSIVAQTSSQEDPIITNCDKKAHFEGDDASMYRDFQSNLFTPEAFRKNRIYVEALHFDFVIEKDGSISNLTVTTDKNTDYFTIDELHLFQSKLSKWIPAQKNNQVVRSKSQINMIMSY